MDAYEPELLGFQLREFTVLLSFKGRHGTRRLNGYAPTLVAASRPYKDTQMAGLRIVSEMCWRVNE